jgi:hypothetical protein
MENIARYTILVGIGLIVIGAIIFGLAKLNIPLGRLPGDIRIEGPNGSFYFPIVTCIILSVLLSVVLSLIGRFWNK